MAVGYTARTMRTMSWSTKAVIAAALLAVLLVAAVPVALLVDVETARTDWLGFLGDASMV